MTNNRPPSPLWTYITECARLLYWTLFKPYTFKRWLQEEIHPELTPKDSPFPKQAEFFINPLRRSYVGRLYLSTAMMPVLMLLTLILSGIIGLSPLTPDNNPFSKEAKFPTNPLLSSEVGLDYFFIAVMPLQALLLFGFVGMIFTMFMASGMALGMFSGVAFRVALDVLLVVLLVVLVVVSVVLVVVSVVFSGVGFGMGGVVLSALFVTVGVAWGLVPGVAFDMVSFVALGVVWIFGVLRGYFWLPELVWMLILFFRSRTGNIAQWLRYLPPYFDELIYLPLPFMDRLIIAAYPENPAAARQTIDYLINSTNQRKVAGQAMAGIAIDTLSRCQHLSDIVNIAEELAWIPSPPPQELGSVLPQLLEVSQEVQASQTATSPYRQSELLKPAINTLRQLQKNLAFTKDATIATSFGNITQRWLNILETAQRTLQEQSRYAQEIPQVYIAGNSLDPATAKSRFKGRRDILREIETIALEEPPPVLLLYGGRRTGKTSALKYLPEKVGASLIPLLVDVQGAASATTLLGLAENLATQIITSARRLPRQVNLPQPNAAQLKQDPFPALLTWLEEIEHSFPGKRFLLCLDEFERLGEIVTATNSRAPLNFLRNVVQHRPRWTLLFSGSHERNELPDYWSDYLINTRTLRLSYLQEPEARELILEPVEDFPKIYQPDAVDAIIQLTRCQPYLVQLVCYELVELLNREIRNKRRELTTVKATAEDVQAVITIALERGGEYFRELWTTLGKREKNLLLRLVQGKSPTEKDKAVIRKLARKEILYSQGDKLQVPLVQEYIQQVVLEEM